MIWLRLSIWSQFVWDFKTNKCRVTLKISAHSVNHIKHWLWHFWQFCNKEILAWDSTLNCYFNTEVSELHNDNFGLDPFDLVVFGCPLQVPTHSDNRIKNCDILDNFAIKKDLVVWGCLFQVPTHSDKHINNCDIMDNFAIKKDLVVCGCPLPVSGNFYGNQFLSPMLQPSGNVLRRKWLCTT